MPRHTHTGSLQPVHLVSPERDRGTFTDMSYLGKFMDDSIFCPRLESRPIVITIRHSLAFDRAHALELDASHPNAFRVDYSHFAVPQLPVCPLAICPFLVRKLHSHCHAQ